MKFKKILLGITGALALTFALTACGDDSTNKNSTPASGDTGGNTSGSGSTDSGQTDISALTFMSDNKIRVDIFGDLENVTFKYNGQDVESKKEISIVADQTFTYSGECSAEKVNYIAYVERASGSKTEWHVGIDTPYFFSTVLPATNFNGVKKVYIALSTGDVQWTTGLNTSLDANFNRYKNMGA